MHSISSNEFFVYKRNHKHWGHSECSITLHTSLLLNITCSPWIKLSISRPSIFGVTCHSLWTVQTFLFNLWANVIKLPLHLPSASSIWTQWVPWLLLLLILDQAQRWWACYFLQWRRRWRWISRWWWWSRRRYTQTSRWIVQLSIQPLCFPPSRSLGLTQTPLTKWFPSLSFSVLFNNTLANVGMCTTPIHSQYANLHPSHFVLFLNTEFKWTVFLFAYGDANAFVTVPSTVFVLPPHFVNSLDGTALGGVGCSGGVEHGASVEFSSEANCEDELRKMETFYGGHSAFELGWGVLELGYWLIEKINLPGYPQMKPRGTLHNGQWFHENDEQIVFQ